MDSPDKNCFSCVTVELDAYVSKETDVLTLPNNNISTENRGVLYTKHAVKKTNFMRHVVIGCVKLSKYCVPWFAFGNQ